MLFLLSSCVNVYFENPQPAGQPNLTEFPKKLVGLYTDAEKGDTVVIISSDGFSMNMNDNDVKIPLSNKTILRKYKSWYFLNLQQESDSLWTVYIVKPGKKKTLELYDFSNEEADMAKLNAITPVKKKIKSETETPSTYINPGIEEMDKILESGLLKPTSKLKR
jgi:hypothetical protein